MIDSEKALIELSKRAQNREYQFDRIYRLVCNPNMYIKAYSNIYKKRDGETSYEFDEQKINKIIESLKNESYKPKPIKKISTPKKNENKRALGIPSFSDKMIQEVCRMILEAIYEPIFLDSSHGFRPNKSCHTALNEIQKTFKGSSWFIKGGINGCFDNISNQILISILQKKIKDERFIRLMWKFLKAGYIKDFKYNNTFSKTPRGGIISPILANIYMNELDKYVEDEIKGKFIQSNKDKETKKISELRSYKNIHYVRYTDDFIASVSGSKEDAINIKSKIRDFLKDNLKLEMSEEKALIIHSKKKARFLNYELYIREDVKFIKDKNDIKKQADNYRVTLLMPKDIMFKVLTEKKVVEDINAEQWQGKARPVMQYKSDLEIVSTYNAEIIGLYNYYLMAENVSARMNKIYHVMQYSCLKTLAGKHKSTVSKIRTKYRVEKDWGIKYDTKNEKGKIRYFYNQGFSMKKVPNKNSDIDLIIDKTVML